MAHPTQSLIQQRLQRPVKLPPLRFAHFPTDITTSENAAKPACRAGLRGAKTVWYGFCIKSRRLVDNRDASCLQRCACNR
jgi:hypothetical protein